MSKRNVISTARNAGIFLGISLESEENGWWGNTPLHSTLKGWAPTDQPNLLYPETINLIVD